MEDVYANKFTELRCHEEVCNCCEKLGLAVQWKNTDGYYEAICLRCFADAVESVQLQDGTAAANELKKLADGL